MGQQNRHNSAIVVWLSVTPEDEGSEVTILLSVIPRHQRLMDRRWWRGMAHDEWNQIYLDIKQDFVQFAAQQT